MEVRKVKPDLYVITDDEITLGTFDYRGVDHCFVFTPAEKGVNESGSENFLLATELEDLSKKLHKLNKEVQQNE